MKTRKLGALLTMGTLLTVGAGNCLPIDYWSGLAGDGITTGVTTVIATLVASALGA